MMVATATADVVVRSRKKGEKIYKDIQDRLDGLNRRVKQFGLLAGAAAIGGIAALTAKSFASADALAKTSEKIGISTQRLGSLNRLAVMAGGSVGGMQEALVKATKRLGEFNTTGGGAAGVWLKRLNLDTKELASLSPDQLFAKYSDSIRGLNSRGEQLAAISALMGDESRALIGLIDQGSSAFEASQVEVEKYALALNGVDSAKIEAANDAVFKVQERFIGIGNVIASKVAPVVTAIANRFLDSGTEADVMGNIVDKVMQGIAVGAGIVADAIFGWKILFQIIRIAVLESQATFVGGLAKIERAIIIVQNKMVEAFGGDLIDVRSGFLTRVEDSLKASSEHAKQVLSEMVAMERPSEGIVLAWEKVTKEAEKAARATAAAREKLQEISAPTFEDSTKDEAAREREEVAAQRLRDRLATRLATIEVALQTETERELLAFENRQAIVDDALERGLISKERALELEAQLQERHEDRLSKIEEKGLSDREKFEALSLKGKAKAVFGFLDEQTAGVANSNKAMFRLNQAAAIGNAVVNISEGITKAWSFGPILGPPLAAIVAAAGAAQIAAIASASPGGGTTPSAAGSTPTFEGHPVNPFVSSDASGAPSGDSTSAPPATVINIFVEGSLIGDEGIKDLLVNTIEELTDSDVLLIPPDSLNAEEIRRGGGG